MKARSLPVVLCSVFLLAPVLALGQRVGLITYQELEDRMAGSPDTTYMVNFWATWCAPCIKEIPYFDQMQEKYAGEKLKVLLVSLDFRSQLEKGVLPFVEANKVRSEVLLLNEPDQASVIDRISPDWSGALPATLLLKGQGELREFHEGSFDFRELEAFYLSHQK